MKFNAQQYFEASLEKHRDAHIVYVKAIEGECSFSTSLYVMGLAVECLLRAFQMRVNTEFNARHDLNELSKTLGEMCPDRSSRVFSRAMAIVVTCWSNNTRYATDARLEKKFKKDFAKDRIKGNHLHYACISTKNSMETIFNIGIKQWAQK